MIHVHDDGMAVALIVVGIAFAIAAVRIARIIVTKK